MDGESDGALGQGQLVGSWWSPAATDVMSQLCRVCGEPAAGFHFGAFTCEGCKSFFGRTYNNLGSITECKNQGACVINKKNRTSCKACRLRKCLLVGMSKSGSRYGRRSNWFKIHCLLQEQQHQHQQHLQPVVPLPPDSPPLEKGGGKTPNHHVRPRSPHAPHAPHASHGANGPCAAGLGSLGAEGLYSSAMLWASPRMLPLPPPPPHGAHLPLAFPPFLPAAAAAAAAAAFNGSAVGAAPVLGVPPRGHAPSPRHEWARLASPLSSGSTSPPTSPHVIVVPVVKAVGPPSAAPPRQPPALPPPRAPFGVPPRRRLSSPRIEVDVDPDAEQEQPMDLSRTAACADRHTPHRFRSLSPASAASPRPPLLGQDADRDNGDGEDKDGSDSGVSERDSDRAADVDDDVEGVADATESPSRTAPVDLSARPS